MPNYTRDRLLENISNYSTGEVVELLQKNNLSECCEAVVKRQVDGEALVNLTERDLIQWKFDLPRPLRGSLCQFVERLIRNPRQYLQENNRPFSPASESDALCNDSDSWSTDWEEEEEPLTPGDQCSSPSLDHNNYPKMYSNGNSRPWSKHSAGNSSNGPSNAAEEVEENGNMYANREEINKWRKPPGNAVVSNGRHAIGTLERKLKQQLEQREKARQLNQPKQPIQTKQSSHPSHPGQPIQSKQPNHPSQSKLPNHPNQPIQSKQPPTLGEKPSVSPKPKNLIKHSFSPSLSSSKPSTNFPKRKLDPNSTSNTVPRAQPSSTYPLRTPTENRNYLSLPQPPLTPLDTDLSSDEDDQPTVPRHPSIGSSKSSISTHSLVSSRMAGGSNESVHNAQNGATAEDIPCFYESIPGDEYVKPRPLRTTTSLPRPLLAPPSPTASINERSEQRKEFHTYPYPNRDGQSRPLPPTPDHRQTERRIEPAGRTFDVPSYTEQPWFHDVGRKEATALVTGGSSKFSTPPPNGYFLVRPSTTSANQPWTLVLWYETKVFNIPVRQRSDSRYALGSVKSMELDFESIEDLINYCKKEAIPITSAGKQVGKTPLTESPPKKKD